MILEIPRIAPGGSDYEGEEPAAVLELESDPDVRPESPLRYRLRAEIVSGGLLVRGRVEADLSLACSRCGAFFSTTVAESCFLRDIPLPVDGVEVDLTGDLREAVLLRLPFAPLCSETCPGVCPQCGAHRGRGACGCRPPGGADAWSALDALDPESPRPPGRA